MSTDMRTTTSTADLVNQATTQVTKLVRDEIALAKIEMSLKAKRMGVGAGLFGTAGLLLAYALGIFLALAVAALALVWSVWLSLLVVGAAVVVIAAVLALIGKVQIKAGSPPVPREAVGGISTDLDTVKSAFHDGRQA